MAEMAIKYISNNKALVLTMLNSGVKKFGDFELPDELVEVAKKYNEWDVAKTKPLDGRVFIKK